MAGLSGQLQVTIHRCRNLHDVKLIGKMDPFVELELADTKYKTSVDENGGTDPSFNQVFEFPVTPGDDVLHIKVKHNGLLSHEGIGRNSIKLSELLSLGTGPQVHWIQLYEWENSAAEGGHLGVSIEFASRQGQVMMAQRAERRTVGEELLEERVRFERPREDVVVVEERPAASVVEKVYVEAPVREEIIYERPTEQMEYVVRERYV